MTKIEELTIYDHAIDKYGIENQKWMVIEECGELFNALAKMRRGRATKEDVMTELADVSIMVEQIASALGYADFLDEREKKLERLMKRLKENG